MSELLPCPFCGSDDVRIAVTMHESWYYGECESCGGRTDFFDSQAEAIEAWNTRAAYEMDGWFYLPKPKDGIVDYGEPEITRTENGYKVWQTTDIVDEAARKWGDELGEYVMRRICEVWNSRAERTCRNLDHDPGWFECSECKCTCSVDYWGGGLGIPNYCPMCGAKVIKEEE